MLERDTTSKRPLVRLPAANTVPYQSMRPSRVAPGPEAAQRRDRAIANIIDACEMYFGTIEIEADYDPNTVSPVHVHTRHSQQPGYVPRSLPSDEHVQAFPTVVDAFGILRTLYNRDRFTIKVERGQYVRVWPGGEPPRAI